MQSREVGTDGGKGLRPRQRAEATGELVLERGHADVTLREIVVEGDLEVGDEAQHLVAVGLEAGDQIMSGGLFDAASLTSRADCGRMLADHFRQDRVIAGEKVLDHMNLRLQMLCQLLRRFMKNVPLRQRRSYLISHESQPTGSLWATL